MPLVEPTKRKKERKALLLELEPEVYEELAAYADFAKTTKLNVVSKALQRLFEQDPDWTR